LKVLADLAEVILDSKGDKSMFWLQSNSKFDVIAEFNPELLVFKILSKKGLGQLQPDKYNGFFDKFPECYLAIFAQNNKIKIVINEMIFVLDDKTIVNISKKNGKRSLDVIKNGKCVYNILYTLENHDIFNDDLTAFIDDEDFDIGLFISNISKDPERKAILSTT